MLTLIVINTVKKELKGSSFVLDLLCQNLSFYGCITDWEIFRIALKC